MGAESCSASSTTCPRRRAGQTHTSCSVCSCCASGRVANVQRGAQSQSNQIDQIQMIMLIIKSCKLLSTRICRRERTDQSAMRLAKTVCASDTVFAKSAAASARLLSALLAGMRLAPGPRPRGPKQGTIRARCSEVQPAVTRFGSHSGLLTPAMMVVRNPCSPKGP